MTAYHDNLSAYMTRIKRIVKIEKSWHEDNFGCGASIFVNPYLKFHSLIPFSPGDNKLKVYESGFRVGLNYKLDRKQ